MTTDDRQTYLIRPLKWRRNQPGEYVAGTPFGDYWVRRDEPDPKFDEPDAVTTHKWGFCFDDYYNEDSFDCKSITDGKRAAWEHWKKVLGACLKPAM